MVNSLYVSRGIEMSGYSEEEFQSFIKQNRDLIERMMALQREAAVNVASVGRDVTHEVVGTAVESAEKAREKTEEFVKTTYNMFTDPEVQKHFMTMGMEFMAGMSSLMQKAPMPDFVKDAANGVESNWKQSACRNNDECAARRAKAQKVKIETDPEPSSDGSKEIVITDYSKKE